MDKQLIDDEFYVEKKKYGTWDSYDKEGKCIITSFTEEECIKATRWFLKFKQEKQYEETTTTYSGSVDYKL
jgi:hypothetical protein